MGEGAVEAVYDAGGDDEVEVLGGPVGLGRGLDVVALRELADGFVAADFDAGLGERGGDAGDELVGDGAVDEEGLDGVADAGGAGFWRS